MKDYIKPTIARKPDMVILQTRTNDLKSNQNPSDIANAIINFVKNKKTSETELSISSLIPRGDQLSEKRKKSQQTVTRKMYRREFCFYIT